MARCAVEDVLLRRAGMVLVDWTSEETTEYLDLLVGKLNITDDFKGRRSECYYLGNTVREGEWSALPLRLWRAEGCVVNLWDWSLVCSRACRIPVA